MTSMSQLPGAEVCACRDIQGAIRVVADDVAALLKVRISTGRTVQVTHVADAKRPPTQNEQCTDVRSFTSCREYYIEQP